MSDKVIRSEESDYEALEESLHDHISNLETPIFTTDVGENALWGAYLFNLPEDRRQYYNCKCCERFIKTFGGLVTISENGSTNSILAFTEKCPGFFANSVISMTALTEDAKVTGVFISGDPIWGMVSSNDKKRSKTWSHLHTSNPNIFNSKLLTSGQKTAEKREEFKMVMHALKDYNKEVTTQVLRVLNADGIVRSEKHLAPAQWFHNLHGKSKNQLWLAVATAPAGFTHIRSSVIATLLDDIILGLPFDDIKNRWSEKMHPLQYQRPQAPPKGNAIEEAEKLVAKLGVERSLSRRFARLGEIRYKDTLFLASEPEISEKKGGVFSHLKTGKDRVKEVDIPPQKTTWVKFLKNVLPTCKNIEIKVPQHGSFYGLVTAVHDDAPPIIQWDSETHRNPFSWFFEHGGSLCTRWDLTSGDWAKCNAIFLGPHLWDEPDKFARFGNIVCFAIEGSKEKSHGNGLALFPEILKSELHGIRSVIEAHSQNSKLESPESGDANGLALQEKATNSTVTVRVNGKDCYHIEKWD